MLKAGLFSVAVTPSICRWKPAGSPPPVHWNNDVSVVSEMPFVGVMSVGTAGGSVSSVNVIAADSNA